MFILLQEHASSMLPMHGSVPDPTSHGVCRVGTGTALGFHKISKILQTSNRVTHQRLGPQLALGSWLTNTLHDRLRLRVQHALTDHIHRQ